MPGPAPKTPQELQEAVLACRTGDWRRGLATLTRLAQREEGEQTLPGYFYSYLGVAMARVEGRRREGIELCRYGVKLGPKDPDNRLNLAMAYLINKDRRRAVRQLEIGLRKHPYNRRLRAFQREIGARRAPIVPFLSRDNLLNVWFGRITYQAQRAREEREEAEREEAEIERLASRG